MSDSCPICLGPIWDDDEEWCPYCGTPLDEEGIASYGRRPYGDEGDLAYSECARGEEHGVRSDPVHDNPRYPPRTGSASRGAGGRPAHG